MYHMYPRVDGKACKRFNFVALSIEIGMQICICLKHIRSNDCALLNALPEIAHQYRRPPPLSRIEKSVR